MATKEMQALRADKDVTVVFIKPEPMEDGRAEKIVKWIESFCASNGLFITNIKRVKYTEEQILAHYSGEGKLEEVGKKVVGAIRMSSPEKRALAESNGLLSKSLEQLGSMVRDIEFNSYIGKECMALTIIGPNATSKMRSSRGASDPNVSGPGTIRREFSKGMGIVDILLNNMPLDNIVHVPLNYDELNAELRLVFNKSAEDLLSEGIGITYPGTPSISMQGNKSLIRT